MADIHQPSDTGLTKTFLIGMATPIVSLACTLTRRERPSWMTREFMYSARILKNVSFAVGLTTGAAVLPGSVCVGGQMVMEEFLMASSSNRHQMQKDKTDDAPSQDKQAHHIIFDRLVSI